MSPALSLAPFAAGLAFFIVFLVSIRATLILGTGRAANKGIPAATSAAR